ncbi:MAG: hypothetical protein ACLQOO_23945 [Terriglobia bacterium]
MAMNPWEPNPKKPEDKWLGEYLDAVGGMAYMEVLVGEDIPHGTRRRLDAVRIPAKAGESGERWRYRDRDAGEFWKLVSEAAEVEVVEVKNQLGPGVIGQAWVGRLLLEKDIKPSKTTVKAVVVSRGSTNARVEEVCHHLGVTTWKAQGGDLRRRARLPAIDLVVKRDRPTRGAIGQLIAAGHLLEKTHSSQLRVNKIIETRQAGQQVNGGIVQGPRYQAPTRFPR